MFFFIHHPLIMASQHHLSMETALSRQRVADEIAAQPRPPPITLHPTTDKLRWRCKNVDGVQTWVYLEDDDEARNWPQTYADKWFLGLPTARLDLSLSLSLSQSNLSAPFIFLLTNKQPSRASPTFRLPKLPSTRSEMASPSSRCSRWKPETGVANMADHCS